MPEWFGHLHKRRSTMTKSLILGAAMALALGVGTAMAQEANEVQNLFDGSPKVFNEFVHGDFATRQSPAISPTAGRGAFSVQTHQLSLAPDGSDGSGH
jgi:hypothetical protein